MLLVTLPQLLVTLSLIRLGSVFNRQKKIWQRWNRRFELAAITNNLDVEFVPLPPPPPAPLSDAGLWVERGRFWDCLIFPAIALTHGHRVNLSTRFPIL